MFAAPAWLLTTVATAYAAPADLASPIDRIAIDASAVESCHKLTPSTPVHKQCNGAACAVLLFYMLDKLGFDKSLIANLNDIKRELALFAGAFVIAARDCGQLWMAADVGRRLRDGAVSAMQNVGRPNKAMELAEQRSPKPQAGAPGLGPGAPEQTCTTPRYSWRFIGICWCAVVYLLAWAVRHDDA